MRSSRFSFLISLEILNGCLHSYLPFLCGFPWVYCLVYDFNYSKQLNRKEQERERERLREKGIIIITAIGKCDDFAVMFI